MEIDAMRVTELLNMRRSKAKNRFRNQCKTHNNFLKETGNKVTFEKTKRHKVMTSEIEVSIVLAWCDTLKYFLFAVILLCLS
jgi:hypothetical protein